MQEYGNMLDEMGLKRIGDILPHYFPLEDFGKLQRATELRGLEIPDTVFLGVYESDSPIDLEKIKDEFRGWNAESYGMLEIKEPDKWNILFPSPRDEKVPTFQLPNTCQGLPVSNWARGFMDGSGDGYYRLYSSFGEKMSGAFYPNYKNIKVSLAEKKQKPVLIILSVDQGWVQRLTGSRKVYDIWSTEKSGPKDVRLPYFTEKAF